MNFELLEDVLDVAAGGELGDMKALRDVRRATFCRERAEDFDFAGGERLSADVCGIARACR